MSEKVTKKDERILRRFYGEKWEEHKDMLLTSFDYSDAARMKRLKDVEGLSAEERLLSAMFREEEEWRPDVCMAEEVISGPLELVANGKEIDLKVVEEYPKIYDRCEKANALAEVLRGILFNDGTNLTDWHLDKIEFKNEDGMEKAWVIVDKEGNNVTGMAYPTLSRALSFLLLEWYKDIDEWLDYAALFMYDGVTGKRVA